MGETRSEWAGFSLFESKDEIATQGFCIDFDFVLDRNAFGGACFGECYGQFGERVAAVVGGAEFDSRWFGVGAVIAVIRACFEREWFPCGFYGPFPFGCIAVIARFGAGCA